MATPTATVTPTVDTVCQLSARDTTSTTQAPGTSRVLVCSTVATSMTSVHSMLCTVPTTSRDTTQHQAVGMSLHLQDSAFGVRCVPVP